MIEKKIRYFIFFSIFFISCKDDISDTKYRNENYVFYEEAGKVGEWLKIGSSDEIKLPKSYSTYFFPDGSVYAEMEVIDSFPNRIIRFYKKRHKQLLRTTTFKSDSIVSKIYENGDYKDYHSNLGSVKTEGTVENNMFQGTWKFYREDGTTIREVSQYENDTLHGICKLYWETGKLKKKFKFQKGEIAGEILHYYKTGDFEERTYQKNGKLHGDADTFYKNGNIKSRLRYWGGKKIDTNTYFFKNGNIEKKLIFNLDTLTLNSTGKAYIYFETGELKTFIETKNYKSHGDFLVYNKDGVIIEKSQKRNNIHQGPFTTYYDTGTKQLEGILDHQSYYHGKLNYFNEKGTLTKMFTYDHGIAIDSVFY